MLVLGEGGGGFEIFRIYYIANFLYVYIFSSTSSTHGNMSEEEKQDLEEAEHNADETEEVRIWRGVGGNIEGNLQKISLVQMMQRRLE